MIFYRYKMTGILFFRSPYFYGRKVPIFFENIFYIKWKIWFYTVWYITDACKQFYRLKEEKNTMDGLCLPEMSYIISFNRIDIDGRFCPDLSRTNDEVNVAHLISLITLCSMIIIVYIFMFLHVLSYVVAEYRFSAMIRKFRISYISTTVNTWMFIHVHILNLLRFSSRTPMINRIRSDVRYVVFCYFSSLYHRSAVYYTIVSFSHAFSVSLFNEEKNVPIAFGFLH